jgi:hypothetical protein
MHADTKKGSRRQKRKTCRTRERPGTWPTTGRNGAIPEAMERSVLCLAHATPCQHVEKIPRSRNCEYFSMAEIWVPVKLQGGSGLELSSLRHLHDRHDKILRSIVSMSIV